MCFEAIVCVLPVQCLRMTDALALSQSTAWKPLVLIFCCTWQCQYGVSLQCRCGASWQIPEYPFLKRSSWGHFLGRTWSTFGIACVVRITALFIPQTVPHPSLLAYSYQSLREIYWKQVDRVGTWRRAWRDIATTRGERSVVSAVDWRWESRGAWWVMLFLLLKLRILTSLHPPVPSIDLVVIRLWFELVVVRVVF